MENDHTEHVQFCHGAPGFVISLRAIQRYFPAEVQQRIDFACQLAEYCIFEKGLLVATPNLCHGISGNALALSPPARQHFMSHTTFHVIVNCLINGSYLEGTDSYGLFCGKAGRAWSWLVLLSGFDKGMIGYSDL